MRAILTALGFLFAGAGAVLAECPTAKDVDGPGVVVEFKDNWSTIYSRTPSGTLLEVSKVGGDDDYFLESEKGIHVIAEGPWKDGEPVSDQIIRFSVPGGVTLPEPTTNMSWSVEYDVLNPDGSRQKSTTRINSGGTAEMTIGGCKYEVIPMHFVFKPANDAGTISALSYVRELGILVLTASGEMGGVYSLFFTPIGIKRVGE